ncbi:hypothetical protein F751_4706 [Auxenochlorella protothecoides]|uniref:START domain-containing protein n=2 Tax=Auxenochlorella protothecoides TaxID=3075 RepID=A0A087SKF9_AUXPR|nr:hypothetical protein F751_4706 [Auxenochlorella protothecoides]KFM26213.1 hypothetical protein F751_4706 [Auxenochlorella protothecoides]
MPLRSRGPSSAASAISCDSSDYQSVTSLGPASAAGVDCDAVLAQEREVAEALEMLAADGDSAWRHLQYKDVLSLWYRQVPHSSRHHLKMKVEVAHPIKHLVAMMHEMCMEPMVVERASIFEARVYTGQWIPSPFKDANILLNVRAFDLADEHSSLLVLFESEDLDVSDPRLPTAVSQRRTIDVLPGSGIRLQALPAGPDGIPRSLADIHLDFDPHFPYVPSVLVSFLLRVLCPYLYNVIIKVLDSQFSGDQGCMYEERVASRPDLYKYLDRRLQGFQPSPAAGA